jgi:hypothetical protein
VPQPCCIPQPDVGFCFLTSLLPYCWNAHSSVSNTCLPAASNRPCRALSSGDMLWRARACVSSPVRQRDVAWVSQKLHAAQGPMGAVCRQLEGSTAGEARQKAYIPRAIEARHRTRSSARPSVQSIHRIRTWVSTASYLTRMRRQAQCTCGELGCVLRRGDGGRCEGLTGMVPLAGVLGGDWTVEGG